MILDSVNSPSDLKTLSLAECDQLAGEIRDFVVEATSRTGGHLGSNLGIVELTLALHRVFDSPADMLLFDTGHQAYVHKLVTGRREGFSQLRQEAWSFGLSVEGRVRSRLDRELPRLDRTRLRARHRNGASSRGRGRP